MEVGRFVRLEPLRLEHADELWPAVEDPEMAAVWPRRWETLDDVRAQVRDQLHQADMEPMLVRDRATGAAVGSSSFYNVRDDRLTVGWTYFAPARRRTAANTETKLLMLGDAFDRRGVRRVRFDVDGRNRRSQDALLRLGAVREGVLRRHLRVWDGFVRDTVVFSILDVEWPAVRARLEARLRRSTPP